MLEDVRRHEISAEIFPFGLVDAIPFQDVQRETSRFFMMPCNFSLLSQTDCSRSSVDKLSAEGIRI